MALDLCPLSSITSLLAVNDSDERSSLLEVALFFLFYNDSFLLCLLVSFYGAKGEKNGTLGFIFGIVPTKISQERKKASIFIQKAIKHLWFSLF